MSRTLQVFMSIFFGVWALIGIVWFVFMFIAMSQLKPVIAELGSLGKNLNGQAGTINTSNPDQSGNKTVQPGQEGGVKEGGIQGGGVQGQPPQGQTVK